MNADQRECSMLCKIGDDLHAGTCSRWKEKVIQARKSGVYEEEPHLLSETLSASMTEQQKFGGYKALIQSAKDLGIFYDARIFCSRSNQLKVIVCLAGTHSQFNRSKYRTQDRRKLGPKFDEYSPHVSKKPDFQNLPLEYRSLIGSINVFALFKGFFPAESTTTWGAGQVASVIQTCMRN
jgi:hypothetical protein